MKPILILQHEASDNPGYLGKWLHDREIAFDVVNAAAGQAFPDDLGDHGALAILGGGMSVNDDLPSLRQAEALVREAVRDGVPTLGHCLGAQLMSKALGGTVGPSPRPEIGWQRVRVHALPSAQAWLGPAGDVHLFHWHYESFSLPDGAEWLASSSACPNQAFSLGPHLGMQFHIEIDADKLELWLSEVDPPDDGERAQHAETIATPAAMRAGVADHLAAHQRLADRIYERWLGFARQRAR